MLFSKKILFLWLSKTDENQAFVYAKLGALLAKWNGNLIHLIYQLDQFC